MAGKEFTMSAAKMDKLSLAQLIAIDSNAMEKFLPNGDLRPPERRIDCASI